MSCEGDSVDVSEEIERLVSDIITRNNLKEVGKIKYYPGSQAGDGYATKTVAVDIPNGGDTLNLFLKCALDIEDKISTAPIIYGNEIFFYKTIYPSYTAFWEDRGVEGGFRNAPACYGFNESRGTEIVALENLRKKGFTLFDRFACMNDDHVKLTLRTFAKFHATSFAMKDQRRDLHNEFCEKCPDVFAIETIFAKMMTSTCKDFVAKLDPIADKDILKKCVDLDAKVYDQVAEKHKYLTNYSIFTKGDCWVSNMMVLYENDDREHPKDVMLVDWQCVTRASPVHDIQTLFYSVASEETLNNYKHYLEIYHDELSKGIEKLGSDPEVLYPFSVFEKEWKDYGIYALGAMLLLMKAMLCESGNAPTFEGNMDEHAVEHMFSNITDNQEEYMRRTKYIVRHMMDIGIL